LRGYTVAIPTTKEKKKMWETLEMRTLLSNATLVTAGSMTTITGDVKDNRITIDATATGYLVTPGQYSLINGSSNAIAVPASVTQFKINLGGGIDKLVINGVAVDSLAIDTAGGDDYVQIQSSSAGSIVLLTGGGNDGIVFSQVSVNGIGINVDAGAGNDYFSVDRVQVQGAFKAQMGSGSDRFAPSHPDRVSPGLTVLGGPVVIDGGGNSDILEYAGTISSDTVPTIINFEKTVIG
jgi:hypothetical protein